MTENGGPLENAIAERMNGILKEEYLNHDKPEDRKQAKEQLDRAIKLYNEHSPHFSIGLLTPELVHSKNLPTEKLWKNYYDKNRKIANPIQDNKQPVNTWQDYLKNCKLFFRTIHLLVWYYAS
jgi:putative transposase